MIKIVSYLNVFMTVNVLLVVIFMNLNEINKLMGLVWLFVL